MSRRMTTILAPVDVGAAGTRVEDINLSGQISRLEIHWDTTTVTVSDMIGNHLDCLSRIELVDGAEVLFSSTGAAIQGINFYEKGKPCFNHIGMAVGAHNLSTLEINFGRFLWDEEFALRPDLYRNLQLRITFDEDASNTAVVVNALTVIAFVDDDPPGGGANGFILTREVQASPMAAAANAYTSLPIDFPLRGVFLRPYSADHAPRVLINNIKLDVDNGKQIPCDVPSGAFIDMIMGDYGAIIEEWCGDEVVTAQALYANTSQNNSIQIEYDGTAFVTAQSLFAVPTWTGEIVNLAASVDIQKDFYVMTGYLPHEIIPIWIGDKMDPKTWLDLAAAKEFRSTVGMTADADAADTLTIMTQQWARY